MRVETFTLGPIETNAYLVCDDDRKKAIVIDPGYQPTALLRRLDDLQCQVEAIFLTHAHFDHIGGLNEVRQQTNAKVYLHALEQDWLLDPQKNGSARYDPTWEVVCERADVLLHGEETFDWLNQSFCTLHTPGHSPGSVSLYGAPYLFSGDALFVGSIGRTDLYRGNHEQLISSIQKKLFSLPDETTVFPGHGPDTTIRFERRFNPFVKER